MSSEKSAEDVFNPTVSEEEVVLAGEYSEQDQRLVDGQKARVADAWKYGLHALASLPDLTPSAETVEAYPRVNARKKMNATIYRATMVNDAFDTVRTQGGNIQKSFEEPQKLDPEHFKGNRVVSVKRNDGTYAEYNERAGAFFSYVVNENGHREDAFNRATGAGIIKVDSAEGQQLLATVKQQQTKASDAHYAEDLEAHRARKSYHDKVELPRAVQAAKDILGKEDVKVPSALEDEALDREIARLKRNKDTEEQEAA